MNADEAGVHSVKILTFFALLISALGGCSSGAFVPGGPHTMERGRLSDIVARQAARAHIPPHLVAAVIRAESGGDPSAVSGAGAAGLMQLMPATARRYGAENRFDPEENVAAGTRYLRVLLARYHHDVRRAIAAYNAGPGAVDAARGVPAFPETRAYVDRVISDL